MDIGDTLQRIDNVLVDSEADVVASTSITVEPERVAVSGVCEASKYSRESLEHARQRNVQVIGRAALALTTEVTPDLKPKDNLADLFEQAASGNEAAQNEIQLNATSTVAEMICKSGSKMTARAQMIDGKLTQFGKNTEDRQYTTLTEFTSQFPELQRMTEAEGQNAFFIEELYKRGVLQTGNKVVEISLVPSAPYESLKDSGLFLREMVAIIRTTEADENGNVTINSYLVGGTDQDKLPAPDQIKTEQDEANVQRRAIENRFDIAAARELLRRFGVENADKLAPNEILATPLLIPAHMDGTDIASMYDAVVKEQTGKPVFMGKADLYRQSCQGQPLRSNYEAQFARVNEIHQNLQIVGKDVARLCAENWQAAGGDAYTAGRLMQKFAEQEAAKYLFAMKQYQDSRQETNGVSIQAYMPDLTVLGAMTYQSIVRNDLRGAISNAKGTGCPSGIKKTTEAASSDLLQDLENSPESPGTASNGESEPSDSFGTLRFKCPKGHWNRRKHATSAEDLKRKMIPTCKTCGTDMSCGQPQETASNVEEVSILELFKEATKRKELVSA